MDHAVSLVQSYLQLNGYFTSAEYPVIQEATRGEYRTLTDIDMLAFRFPPGIKERRSASRGAEFIDNAQPSLLRRLTDPGLEVPDDKIDMIIGEVKEGKVGINSGSRDPEVIRNVLERFGYLAGEAANLVDDLLSHGWVTTSRGAQVRMVAFGAFPPGVPVPPCRIISLGHVLKYLQTYVRQNWAMLRHCQFKDPAFSFLMTLEKARRGGAGRRGNEGVEIVPSAAVARPGGKVGRGTGKPEIIGGSRPRNPRRG
jgi:hypothetical protein